MKLKLFRIMQFMALTLIMIMVSLGCTSQKMLQYYEEKDNYVHAVGTVTSFSYNEKKDSLYINFSETIPVFDDLCFKITGDNLKIVQAEGIDNKLHIGGQIEFMTAPRYFGDGYVMPIVSLTLDGTILLDFETGYNNLLDYIR